MCYSLHVHVVSFFRFYRGAEGRVSSFSCTNATVSLPKLAFKSAQTETEFLLLLICLLHLRFQINKFKDALAKHGPERCSLGPARGLEESELMALAANKDLQFTYEKPDLVPLAEAIAKEAAAPGGPWFPLPVSATQLLLTQGPENNSLLSSGR